MTAGNYTKAWAAIFAFTALMAAGDTDAESSAGMRVGLTIKSVCSVQMEHKHAGARAAAPRPEVVCVSEQPYRIKQRPADPAFSQVGAAPRPFMPPGTVVWTVVF
jgi:hypothetical protein